MSSTGNSYKSALIVMIVVCFLLGFITTLNNSLIDFCKQVFHLKENQVQLVNTAFYGAFILSIPLALLMRKMGYKSTLALGIGVIGLGFALANLGIAFFAGQPAAFYPFFLGSMSVVAIGIVLLQLVTNPYLLALGPPEQGAFRMTLSQTFNSLGTTIAPIFVSLAIVSGSSGYNINAIGIPFVIISFLAFVLFFVLQFMKLPVVKEEKQALDEGKVYKKSMMQYPRVYLGAIAIFMYLGVEVGIPSFLPAKIRLLMDAGTIGSQVAPTTFLPWYWGGLLAGRFFGTILLRKVAPRQILTVFTIAAAGCVGLSFVLPGIWSVYAMISAGLFHSVMWPLIFNLSLVDLGPHTKAASGLINTGVIGAAVLTPLMGKIAETAGLSMAIGMLFIYYAYILLFSEKLSKISL